MKSLWILLVAVFIGWVVVSIRDWLRRETSDDFGCASNSENCPSSQSLDGAYLFDCSDSEPQKD